MLDFPIPPTRLQPPSPLPPLTSFFFKVTLWGMEEAANKKATNSLLIWRLRISTIVSWRKLHVYLYCSCDWNETNSDFLQLIMKIIVILFCYYTVYVTCHYELRGSNNSCRAYRTCNDVIICRHLGFDLREHTVKTRIKEQVFGGLRLILFLYIGCFLQNQPENVLKFLDVLTFFSLNKMQYLQCVNATHFNQLISS